MKVNPEDIIREVYDANIKGKLRSCQHLLVDSELKGVRHKIVNYGIDNLNAKIKGEKLDLFLNNLNCAAFAFILKTKEDWGITYSYAYENNFHLERSHLVCSKDDLAKLKDILNKTDVIDSCSRGRMETKWKFYKWKILTVISALLKELPMVCKDAFLPQPLLKNRTDTYLTFEENTKELYDDHFCLFRALVVHLHGNQLLEEGISKSFNSFINHK